LNSARILDKSSQSSPAIESRKVQLKNDISNASSNSFNLPVYLESTTKEEVNTQSLTESPHNTVESNYQIFSRGFDQK